MNINTLSFEEKIGQRFIFGVNSDNTDCIIKLIKEYNICGVILYKRNYSSYDEMIKVIKKLKSANKNNKIPLFIAIDQEGGKVNRMPKEIHNIKNIYDISKTSDKLVSDTANIIGKMLKDTGINMNFAPVVDIYNNSNSRALYKRCFYGEYFDVIRNEKIYLSSLKNNNIISVVKHYPGHGASILDSHFFIPYVFDYKGILDKHIIPFDEAIKSGVDAIMVGHLVIRKLTGGIPASISKNFIDEYLKNKFNGLIITDEINMLKRNIFYKFIYLRKALMSSSDVILVKIRDYEDGEMIINKYKNILENNKDYLNLLDYSVNKIIDIKNKYGINDSIDYDGIDIDNINGEIDKINSKVITN